jgi:hypothetical protein
MVSIWLTKVNGGGENSGRQKSASLDEADSPQMPIRRRLLAILLDSGSSQASKAVLIDGKLPGEEFVDGQRVTAASFLEGKQAAADCGNDFGLATDNPSLGPGCGQICDR